MADYYDPDGNELTLLEWSQMFEARHHGNDHDWWKRTTSAEVAGKLVTISTVWLGLNHSFDPKKIEIYETMIFSGDDDGDMYRYATREEAWAHHDSLVQLYFAGKQAVL